MCQHIELTTRSGSTSRYSLMDCTKDASGVKGCEITDKSLAHLMASGQFRKILVQDQKEAGEDKKYGYNGPTRTYVEAEFAAFIEKTLGAQALQERHHAPEAVGLMRR